MGRDPENRVAKQSSPGGSNESAGVYAIHIEGRQGWPESPEGPLDLHGPPLSFRLDRSVPEGVWA